MDISNFCSILREEKRGYCIKPWNYNGLTIATDSRVIISVPEQYGYPDGKDYSIADSAYNLLQDGLSIQYEKLPIELKPSGSQCSMCFGHGRINFEECPECHGFGIMTFGTKRHYYECSCEECDGEGEYKFPAKDGQFICPKCHGFGHTNKPKKVLNGYYAYHYLKKITDLQGLLVGSVPDKNYWLYFKADYGVRGALAGFCDGYQ